MSFNSFIYLVGTFLTGIIGLFLFLLFDENKIQSADIAFCGTPTISEYSPVHANLWER